MFYKLSLIFLVLSVPFFFVAGTLFGIPFWAVVSLGSTVCFAVFAIVAIEKEWQLLKGKKR